MRTHLSMLRMRLGSYDLRGLDAVMMGGSEEAKQLCETCSVYIWALERLDITMFRNISTCIGIRSQSDKRYEIDRIC